MKRWMTAVLAAALALAGAAHAQPVRVGYVDLPRIERESAQAVRAGEALKQEFDERGRQVQELQRRIEAAQRSLEDERAVLTASQVQERNREISEMMRQSNQMVERIAEEYEQRKGEYSAKLIEEVRAAIHAVAKAGKFDLIVADAVFAGPAVDITARVMKEMARRGASPR